MAIAHAQPVTNHLSASHHVSMVVKACSGALKAKPLRVVPKPAVAMTSSARVEITPVFVGIAG